MAVSIMNRKKCVLSLLTHMNTIFKVATDQQHASNFDVVTQAKKCQVSKCSKRHILTVLHF